MEQGTFDLGEASSPAPVKLCECGCGKPAPIAMSSDRKRGVVKGQPTRFILGHHLRRKGPQPWNRKLFVESGQRIGRSVVIDPDVRMPPDSNGHARRGARLRCDCGKEYERLLFSLLNSADPSCGCVKPRFIDRTGQQFGKLTVIRLAERKAEGRGDGSSWLCKCDCGNEAIVRTTNLATGHTKSCGCLSKRRPRRGYLPGQAAFNKVLRSYRKNAQTRGLPWELTEEDFRRLTSQDCHYCGAPPSMIGKVLSQSGECVYNGLDRIDNALGYTLQNVVSACKICNHAKKDMSYDEFTAWITRLIEYRFFRPEAMPSRLLA